MVAHPEVIVDPDKVRFCLQKNAVTLSGIGAEFFRVGAETAERDLTVCTHHGLHGRFFHHIPCLVQMPHGVQNVEADTADAGTVIRLHPVFQHLGKLLLSLRRPVAPVGIFHEHGHLIDHVHIGRKKLQMAGKNTVIMIAVIGNTQ